MRQLDRFLSKVDKGDCWLWTAAITSRGYGSFYRDGKMESAHRVSYETFVGVIPEGLEIDHLCRNPACVNPAHLEAVTHKVNMERSDSFHAKKTHCPRGHEYSHRDKQGTRCCRVCDREKCRRHARRRRAVNKEPVF